MADAVASAGYGTLAMLLVVMAVSVWLGTQAAKGRREGRLHQGLLPRQSRPGRLGPGADGHRAKRRHLHGLSLARLYARLDRGAVDRQLHGRADHRFRRAGQALCAAFAAHRRHHGARLVRRPLRRPARGADRVAVHHVLHDLPDGRAVQGRRDRDEAGLARQRRAGAWPKTRRPAASTGPIYIGLAIFSLHRRRLHADRRLSGLGVDRSVSKRADGHRRGAAVLPGRAGGQPAGHGPADARRRGRDRAPTMRSDPVCAQAGQAAIFAAGSGDFVFLRVAHRRHRLAGQHGPRDGLQGHRHDAPLDRAVELLQHADLPAADRDLHLRPGADAARRARRTRSFRGWPSGRRASGPAARWSAG